MPQFDDIRLRRGTAAQWTNANPVLADGEPGVARDTRALKIGDGVTPWASLPDITGELAGSDGPRYLDSYNTFFRAPSYVHQAGQGATGTTATAPAAAGSSSLAVASGVGFVDGAVIVTNAGTAQQQQHKIASGGETTTLTLDRPLDFAVANAAAVTPLWKDLWHLTNVGASAFAYWLMDARLPNGTRVIQDPGGRPIVWLGNSWALSGNGGAALDARVAILYPSATVVRAGVGGNTSAQMLARFDTDVPANAAYVIFNEPGINDLVQGSGIAAATQAENLAALTKKIRAIGAVPVFTGPVPLADRPAAAADQAARMAALTGSTYPAVSGPGVYSLIAGINPITSSGSVGVGLGAAAVDTSTQATAVGGGALAANTSGTRNTAVGKGALGATTTGNNLTALGFGALAATTTANNLTAIGNDALAANTSGTANVAVGTVALTVNTSGANNTGLGFAALTANTTGSNNTAVGNGALRTNATSSSNTAVGSNALAANTAANNTAVGNSAGAANTSGTGNVAIGTAALTVNTTGASNVAIGLLALGASNATNNTAIGTSAMGSATTASGNTVVGKSAMASATIGGNNTAIGMQAGLTGTSANATIAGAANTFVGYNTGPASTSDPSYATALGAGATVAANGGVAIGVDTNGSGASAAAANEFALGTALHTVNVAGKLRIAAQTPSTAGAAGTAGQIAWDASYLYVCVATNTWKRTALAAW